MDVRSLVVVKDGKIVFERYGDGLTRDNNYELYSVTKTITSLLVEVLEGEGKLNPTTRVAPLIAKSRPDLASQLADKQDIELRPSDVDVERPQLSGRAKAPIRSITARRIACASR